MVSYRTFTSHRRPGVSPGVFVLACDIGQGPCADLHQAFISVCGAGLFDHVLF